MPWAARGREWPCHKPCLALERLRHAGEKGFLSGTDRIGSADMHPDPVHAQAEQTLLLIGAVEQLRQ